MKVGQLSASTLEIAAILGEAIARAHLAGDRGARNMNSKSTARQHFDVLNREKQDSDCLADEGPDGNGTVAATELSVEQIRQIESADS